MLGKRVVFVSTMPGWFASEELWGRTAVDMARQGVSVSASVVETVPLHRRLQELKSAGIYLQVRPSHYTLWRRGWDYVFCRGKPKRLLEVDKLLRSDPPDLIVFSDGGPYPPIELLELCVSKNLPFVTIANGHSEYYWPEDQISERYRKVLRAALRCYFVSKANVRLTEMQIGCELPNAEVVWSQYNVDFNFLPPWPDMKPDEELRFACVGRLYPPHKGQDILLEALASPVWARRPWHLDLYGEGPMRHSLERLTTYLGIYDRVTFAGYVTVEDIWSKNQALIMPSRCEGLPLAMVEAMLCGRPVLATDVAGHSELIIDGVTGFLVGAPTVTSLAQGLERLWDNRANLKKMGSAGAKRIREVVPSNPIRVFSDKVMQLI